MRAIVITPPASEPLTIEDAKKQLEIASSDSSHDEHLYRVIQSAREQWERDTDTCVITQTLQVKVAMLKDGMRLPKQPIQSITSIVYRSSISENVTMPTSIYELDAPNREIRLKYNQNWPTMIDHWDAATITYVAGYADRSLIPEAAKQAMLLLVGHYFGNRDMLIGQNFIDIRAYDALRTSFMRSTYP